MGRQTFVQLCRGEDDWKQLKSCFVRAFFNYPLFVYVVPDKNKREEFLRRYLEAHYDISVRNGNSPLICIHLLTDTSDVSAAEVSNNNEDTSSALPTKIIGGVLFTGPAENGVGWEYEDDDVYEKAYRKFKLDEVDEQAFERLTRFETWETEHITSKLFALKIPMWNGVFCAIDPVYANAGVGTMNYADCIYVISQNQLKRQNQLHEKTPFKTNAKLDGKVKNDSASVNFTDRVLSPGGNQESHRKSTKSKFPRNEFCLKLLHSLSLLNHRSYQIPICNIQCEKKDSLTPVKENTKSDVPVMIMLSQSHRAVEFHKRNGFRCVHETSFTEESTNSLNDTIVVPQFTEYVLVSDPFGRGTLMDVFKDFNIK